MNRIVLCMKWGDLYSADYVNILARAVADHIDGDFKIICLTDNADGIIDGVDCIQIPELGLDPSYWGHGAWPKLVVFKDGLLPANARCLFIDLDTVITGDLDPMFETGKGVTMILEWKRLIDYINPFRPKKALSGVFAFDTDSETQIWDKFIADPATARTKYRLEQYCLADFASHVQYWPAAWVQSFKRHLFPPSLRVRDGAKVKGPAPTTKMLAFHGDPRPVHVATETGETWGKSFRYGKGAVPFVKEYWSKYRD